MKKILFLAICVLGLCTQNLHASAKSKANAQTAQWRYEIECEGTGGEGTYLVKVTGYSLQRPTAYAQLQKNAVHGVIFKGIPGKSGVCTSQRALAGSAALEQENAAFFERFFSDEGESRKYANIINTPEFVKLKGGLSGYKVTATLSVSKDQLRKDLEAAGVLKGLGSGF